MEHFLQIKILHGVATVLLFGGKNWNPMAYSQDTGLFY
ncbi:hypothetical protein K3Z96_28480, partial [Pseudomonas aeruginosa]|nr:hypothetical protein [Pseudomonas aeruginosa]